MPKSPDCRFFILYHAASGIRLLENLQVIRTTGYTRQSVRFEINPDPESAWISVNLVNKDKPGGYWLSFENAETDELLAKIKISWIEPETSDDEP